MSYFVCGLRAINTMCIETVKKLARFLHQKSELGTKQEEYPAVIYFAQVQGNAVASLRELLAGCLWFLAMQKGTHRSTPPPWLLGER